MHAAARNVRLNMVKQMMQDRKLWTHTCKCTYRLDKAALTTWLRLQA